MSKELQEADIRAALADGGRIRGAFLVARLEPHGLEFMVYLRPSWDKNFLPLRTWRSKADRTYRDVGRLFQLIGDDFGYWGPICVYPAGSPELLRFKELLPIDAPGSTKAPGQPNGPYKHHSSGEEADQQG